MSRSWERRVRKNMSKINQQRKKQGSGQLVLGGEKVERFKGRNIFVPILLLLFVILYSILMNSNPDFEMDTMYAVTLLCYVALAALFFFRRPYLLIGKDFVQSRRFTGDKRYTIEGLKSIRFQQGMITIIPQKGANWTFSKTLNRFPTENMESKLREFAKANNIMIEEN
ncbi:hypothetical protein [Paenibacillus sp. HB172176]|uniref:hypothetical protein n=1 Tax=Paenibacillus sp. HB172176 TaxID=2493690 RepID=UPI00143A80CB|nr:hypothetical protein [Paenibacillus sp. HB172176]